MARQAFSQPSDAVVHPFGDLSALGTPLFLETGGSVLSSESPENEFCWTVLHFSDDRYEGTAVRPQGRIADAFGKYIFAEDGSHESFYAGEWRETRPNGAGVRQYGNGSIFVGEVASTSSGDSVPNGLGLCTLANADWIAGEWRDGVIHGRGMQHTSQGGASMYVGCYTFGLRSGLGVYNFMDDSEYAGEFDDDEPHGMGSYSSGSTSYVGGWDRGRRNGWSIFKTHRGLKTWAGRWAAGHLVWSVQLHCEQEVERSSDMVAAIKLCWRAAKEARAQSKAALRAADCFCDPEGELQTSLDEARRLAATAAKEAESAARKARALKPQEWQPQMEEDLDPCRPSHPLQLTGEHSCLQLLQDA